MTLPLHIHVIDDDYAIRDSFGQALNRLGCEVSASPTGMQGINHVMRHPTDLVLLDLMLPDISGIDVLRKIRSCTPNTAIIIITGHPCVETAVTVIKLGAYDYIPKPCNANTLRTTVSRALEARRLKTDQTAKKKGLESIIGDSPIMQDLLKLIAKAAESDCLVLITGETGTGKEMVANALHNCSRRHDHPFITVDAGGLVDTLIESELFGHVRGAFTGAHADRTGRFELANGGTLFLDEITNMDYRSQGKLLRVIENRQIVKVGQSQCTTHLYHYR